MNKKEDYVKKAEQQIEKYKDKISKIDNLLRTYQEKDKAELISQGESLKNNLGKAEQAIKDIVSASEEHYEDLKEKAEEVFGHIKEAFHDFSYSLALENLAQAKEEVIDFSTEKLDEMQDLFRKRPLTAALWSLGIGFLLGCLLTRSK